MNSHASPIHTSRLTLIAATTRHLRTELESYEQLGELLCAAVPSSWPPGMYDRDAMQFFLEKSLQGGDAVTGWYGWYAIRREQAEQPALLIGSIGYFGPPNSEGVVEIGYSVVPEVRGKGYAREMAEAIMMLAWRDERVGMVVAEAHETNLASRRVLEHCGFKMFGAGREEGFLRFGILRTT